MAAAPPVVQRRLATLFLVALLGVVVVLSLVAWSLLGLPGLVGWLCLVSALLAAGAARARRAVAAARPAQRHCTCCDGDHTAPVQVL